MCLWCVPRCTSKLQAMRKVLNPFVKFFAATQRDPALSRWLGPQESLGMWSFLTNCFNIGRQAWLSAFPQKVSDLAIDLNDFSIDETARFRLEQAKRKRSCHDHLSIPGVGRDLLLHAIVSAPFDGLVHVLMKHSSNEASSPGREPVIFSMLDETAGPIIETQCKIAALLDPMSDLQVAIQQFVRAEKASSLGVLPEQLEARVGEMFRSLTHCLLYTSPSPRD